MVNMLQQMPGPPSPSRHEPPGGRFTSSLVAWQRRQTLVIACLALAGITTHLVLRFLTEAGETARNIPLVATLLLGGGPLVFELLVKVFHREFGSDLLAGISIVTSILLGEYLAGAIVVLMLSGGGGPGNVCGSKRLLSAPGAGKADAFRGPPCAGGGTERYRIG